MEAKTRFIIAPDDPGTDSLDQMLQAKVRKVFDGDGFLADVWHPRHARWINRIPCRLAFIDAPELAQPLGAEAKEFLTRLIVGKAVRLDLIGKESSGYLPVDQYKRMLCMAYVIEEIPVGEIEYYLNNRCNIGVVKRARPAVRNVELEMIVNGWAWVVRQYAFDREEDYFAAQDDAERERRGLWASANPEAPWKFKQRRKVKQKTGDGRQAGLFAEPCQAPGCDGDLVARTGTAGTFLGCSKFPRCRYSRSD